MPEIVLTFNISGECQIEAQGFRGKSCTAATSFLKEALGQVSSETKKSEWFMEELNRTGSVNTNLCG